MKRLLCTALLWAATGLFAVGCDKADKPLGVSLDDPENAAKVTVIAKDNYNVPLSSTVYISCIDEVVDIVGTLQVVGKIFYDADNRLHYNYLASFHNLTATGQATGDVYRGIANYTNHVNVTGPYPAPGEQTRLEIARLVGRGPGNVDNYTLLFHITVTPNDEEVVRVDDIKYQCP